MHARPFGIVGIGTARDQIGPVGGQRAVDRDRRAVGAAVLAARQLLRSVLRLEEGQDVLPSLSSKSSAWAKALVHGLP